MTTILWLYRKLCVSCDGGSNFLSIYLCQCPVFRVSVISQVLLGCRCVPEFQPPLHCFVLGFQGPSLLHVLPFHVFEFSLHVQHHSYRSINGPSLFCFSFLIMLRVATMRFLDRFFFWSHGRHQNVLTIFKTRYPLSSYLRLLSIPVVLLVGP